MSSKHMRAILFWGWNRWPNFLRYSLYSWLMSRWVRVLYNQGFSLYSCIFSWNECTCTLYVQLNFNYMRSIFLSSICRVTQVAGFRYLKPNLWFMQKSLVDVKNVTTRLAWGTVWSTKKKWNMKSVLWIRIFVFELSPLQFKINMNLCPLPFNTWNVFSCSFKVS